MSNPHHNPFGRTYNAAELNAAMTLGITTTQEVWNGEKYETLPGGPLVYATGPYWPEHLAEAEKEFTKKLEAVKTLRTAINREWEKEKKKKESP